VTEDLNREYRERLDAINVKRAHSERSLAALESLREELGIRKYLNSRHGLEWLLTEGPRPLIDVRCTRGHKLGGVWRTPAGALFAACPEVSPGRQWREGRYIVGDGRHRMIVDLVAEQDPFATDTQLRVSCDCRGLRSVPSGTRQRLAAAYERALASRRERFVVNEPER
jgi:hypothetical protein